jgi:hypothetical protein
MVTLELGLDARAIYRIIARHHPSREMSAQRPYESLPLALVVAIIR